MVEAAAIVAVTAATQPALVIQAITAIWVVPVRARTAATSAVVHKGAVIATTKAGVAAVAVTMVAATAVARNSDRRSFETAGPSGSAFSNLPHERGPAAMCISPPGLTMVLVGFRCCHSHA
jgi:hypothetical protein